MRILLTYICWLWSRVGAKREKCNFNKLRHLAGRWILMFAESLFVKDSAVCIFICVIQSRSYFQIIFLPSNYLNSAREEFKAIHHHTSVQNWKHLAGDLNTPHSGHFYAPPTQHFLSNSPMICGRVHLLQAFINFWEERKYSC